MDRTKHNDADLVAESLGGSRDAFRQIVERYQTLISSLAYSATGNVSRSEDLAQETFLVAWTRLRSLREPEKLRPWLCGIVRNRIQRDLREEGHEPARNATPLEDAPDWPAREAMPSEQAISREEETILWRSLEKIPELYREPLVLFYREHQSVEQVADALELSEDAVKQRLSRGRKLLQEEVQAFLENTLRRTAPGQAFSDAVLAVLPAAAGPAATAGMGAGAKGTAAAKSGFLAMWVAPFVGILAGIVAQWFIIRATTPERRLRVKKLVQLVISWVVVVGYAVAGERAVYSLGRHFQWDERIFFTAVAGFWCFYLMAMQTWIILGLGRILATSRVNEEAGEIPRTGMTPMKPGILAVVVAGVHLALFSGLIRLAWRANDLVAAGTISGMMVMLCLAAFVNTRGQTGAALARAGCGHLRVCFAMILAIVNLRFDVWVASGYGVSVAEIHNRLPTWIVPLLTLVLVMWTGVVLALAKPKPRLWQQSP